MITGTAIADDVSLELVGHFGGYARNVAVAGGYAYLVQEGDLVILDFSDAANPSELWRVTTTAVDVVIAGNYAYLAGSDNGLVIVDISNPTLPTRAGSYDAIFFNTTCIS